MRLTKVVIEAFRSIKTRQEITIDPNVTVLIGANDHGKSNILAAIELLNIPSAFKTDDLNWDVEGNDRPLIEWYFELTDEECRELVEARLEGESTQDEATEDAEAGEDVSDSEVEEGSEESEEDQTEPTKEWLELVSTTTEKDVAARGKVVRFYRYGTGKDLYARWGKGNPTKNEYLALYRLKPQIEVFRVSPKVIDSIDASQLDSPEFEFMKGIFVKAGLWDRRNSVFNQNGKTSRQLDDASDLLTKRLQSEWEQGKDLCWKFKHKGSEIVLEIRDPAVGQRYVRPTQRSTGFTSFFVLALALYARTAFSKKRDQIFLFDEPGTFLHPVAQINLQRVFETLSAGHQIVYTTHSLFLVNKNVPSRNKVVRKSDDGTVVDRRPYSGNWKSVRDCLGLLFTHNFLISERTLLVEGPSDEIYILALVAFLVRSGSRDIDLNDFSVADAGDSRNQVFMSKLMLEEGRKVVALLDGDTHGEEVSKDLKRIAPEHLRAKTLAIRMLDKHCSTEDCMPFPELIVEAVELAAHMLVDARIRELSSGVGWDQIGKDIRSAVLAKPTGVTLGRHIDDTTRKWFTNDEPISKLLVSERYESLLREKNTGTVSEKALKLADLVIDALELKSRRAERSILGGSD